MKVVSRLLAALMIAGLVLPILASPVLAAADINNMTIRPSSSGPVGTEVYLIGESDTSDEGWVYFEMDVDDWVLMLDNNDWEDFDEVDDNPMDEDPAYWEFQTDTFEIPECIGGTHRIAVLTSNRGTAVDDYDEITSYQAGGSVAIKAFTVEPEIVAVSDNKGPAGTEVEVEGTGFGDTETITIYFDGEEVDLVSTIRSDEVGNWTGSFVVPPSSQGLHDITAGGDDTNESAVNPASFEVTPGISISPLKGVVGSQFIVTGSGFRASERNIEILLAGKVAKSGISADADGVFETSVTVPATAQGNQEVGARGQNTTLSSVAKRAFEVQSSLVVEPLSGNLGTQIEVSGTGLPASTTVTVSYDGVTKGTGTTTADGTLAAITIAATHTQTVHTADHQVSAVFNSTTITETFVMESTAPAKPSPRTPLSGTRIGVLGKQTPTLTWSVVDDPSGVTYSLQISATPDFSQILISKSGMVAQGSAIIVASSGPEVSYSLTEAEALPFGTYYWRVKAVDGVLNDSGWSASNTFKAGLLPTWALIIIVVLAAVLIGALIYVLIIRDRVGLYD